MNETEALSALKESVFSALETYSNIHRGSGYTSEITTLLFEKARELVLEYLELNKNHYVVIFCSPRMAEIYEEIFESGSYRIISSADIGLALGIRAMAVKKSTLPKGKPFYSGGGTTRLISSEWVLWAKAPERFEPGTPAIINIIAFAKALQLIKKTGLSAFNSNNFSSLSVQELFYEDHLSTLSGLDLLNQLKDNLIGKDIQAPTTEGLKTYVHLDNGASTRTFSIIWDVVWKTWNQPPESHDAIIREVKSICARVLDFSVDQHEILFTTNTTEAINLVAESMKNEFEDQDFEPVILNTILEHNSNDLPWRGTPGLKIIRINVDENGFIDLPALEKILIDSNEKCIFNGQKIKLVSVSGASNVLGVYNDISGISSIAHRYGARILIDGAQLVAHRDVCIERDDIDYFVFSAHKVYAPFGAGLLIAKKESLCFNPMVREQIQCSGEENIAGLAALGKALHILQSIGFAIIKEEEQRLTQKALQGLLQLKDITVFGIQDPHSALFEKKGGVIVFKIKGLFANEIAKTLADRGGIGIRYGCHCAHIIIKRLLKVSPALENFQRIILKLFPGVNLPGLPRISMGIENSVKDIDAMIFELKRMQKPAKTNPVSDNLHLQISGKEAKVLKEKMIKERIYQVYGI